MHYGYRAGTPRPHEQAVQRPIRARQSFDEWTKVLTVRADEAAADPRPAVRVLVLGLAAAHPAGRRSPRAGPRGGGTAGPGNSRRRIIPIRRPPGPRRDLGEAVHGAGSRRGSDYHAGTAAADDGPRRRTPATYALAQSCAGSAYCDLGDTDRRAVLSAHRVRARAGTALSKGCSRRRSPPSNLRWASRAMPSRACGQRCRC